MMYNLLRNTKHPNIHPIIPAEEGLSDLAFAQGWRVRSTCGSKWELENMAMNTTEDSILNLEQFNNLLWEDTDFLRTPTTTKHYTHSKFDPNRRSI